ncbi:MAG TPA: hypothetical protein VF784_13655 [Anaerolineales bacterium]
MKNEERLAVNLPHWAIRRPLSLVLALGAGMVIVAAMVLRIEGNTLIGQLNGIDAFTPVMISVLMLRGLYAMRGDTDLQAVSISLIGALSFIFIYEAIYKISFYAPPRPMPPPEVREFVIQCGIALTAAAGFAFGKFHFSRWSKIFAVAFVLLYVFWILVGYPQVDTNANVYWEIIPIHFTWNMIYAVNRATKFLMFLTYLFFYSGDKSNQPATLEAGRSIGA